MTRTEDRTKAQWRQIAETRARRMVQAEELLERIEKLSKITIATAGDTEKVMLHIASKCESYRNKWMRIVGGLKS